MNLSVRTNDKGHYVVDGDDEAIVAGPFQTNREAWRTLDLVSGDPLSYAQKKTDWMWEKFSKQGAI